MTKVVRVGINGFGRIGRNVFRAWLNQTYKKHQDQDVEVQIVAINDLKSPKELALLTQFDSVHGELKGNYSFTKLSKDDENWMIKYVNKENTYFYAERDPSNIPWDKHQVDVVFECTGFFRDKNGMSKHLGGTVKKVILSAPGKDVDKTFVMGVNEGEYDKDQHHLVSNASCTTNCLAPLAKAVDEELKIISGTMTTVHAFTADQSLQDMPHSDPRRARAATLSMIPTSTGAAKAVGEVLPHLKGKLDGGAIRVPTPNVSLVDVAFQVEKETTEEEVREFLKNKSNEFLTTEDRPLVSVDFNGNTYSSVVDLELVKVVNKTTVKIQSWYDNEVGYSNRMLNLACVMFSS